MASPMKSCGSCNFCCKVMEIDELQKPFGEWCGYAKPGKGCSIYGEHPASCQAFSCQWLIEPEMPDEYRPDRTKVVLTADHDCGHDRLVANCDTNNPVAWRREPMYSLLKKQATISWGAGMIVVAKAGRRLWLITPSEDLDLGEVHERSPFLIEQLAETGKVKVTVLPPLAVGEDLEDRMKAYLQ
jgi:hypothetical protein